MPAPTPSQAFPSPGPGPGAAVFQALGQAWGARVGDRPSNPEWVLPAWWQLVSRLDQARAAGWTGDWRSPLAAGAWAPGALVLLTHETGGRLAVDLDPDETGRRGAWWHEGRRLVRVAEDLFDLARWLGQGPETCLEWTQDAPMAPVSLAIDDLPPDPLTQRWRSEWQPGMQPVSLDAPAQGLELPGAWLRHPTRPWLALG